MSEFERMAREESSDSEYGMVEKDILLAFLMCSICDCIVSNATTITECLHFFCQECITHKIIKENCHHCPQCKTFIGINPVAKIRADHNKRRLVDALYNLLENPEDVNQSEENRKANVGDKEGSSSTHLAYAEVIEGSSSSTAIVGSNFPSRAMVKTKKRSMPSRKKRVMTPSGRSKDTHTGSLKQAKAPDEPRNGSGRKNVLNFDLNMPPPLSPTPETLSSDSDPERSPITIVYALPYPAVTARPCRPPKKAPIPSPSSAHRDA